MIATDASPLLAERFPIPTAGLVVTVALRALFAHQHTTFVQALRRYDFDEALERWTDDAVIWMPGQPPCYGKRAIRALLVSDRFPTEGPFRSTGLRRSGVTVYETGVCGRGLQLGDIHLEYSLLWTRTARGQWRVARELWDFNDPLPPPTPTAT
jgi:ketosteroid isomerase-like protein